MRYGIRALLASLMIAGGLFGQALSGTIVGTVTDSTGAVVATLCRCLGCARRVQQDLRVARVQEVLALAVVLAVADDHALVAWRSSGGRSFQAGGLSGCSI